MRAPRRLVPLLACAPLLAAACASSEPKLTAEQEKSLVERYTETANEYLRMGELDRAEGQTMKALELDPSNKPCKLIRGWTLQKRGKTEDLLAAERIFREIQGGDDYRVTLGLAECLERKGLAFDEAARDIASGKRVSEASDPAARVTQLQRERDRAWKESIERYEQTLREHPDDVDAMNGGMRVTALVGRLEDSVAYADKLVAAIRPTRDFWEKRIMRPEITIEDEKLFRERIRHLADLELATRIHASTVLHQLGHDDAALAQLDEAIVLDPERPELFGRRAELQRALGHPDRAITEIDTFLRLCRQSYDHPDVKRAWRMRKECEDEVRAAAAGPGASR